MIRINLVAADRDRGRKRIALPALPRVTAVAVLIVMATAAGVGYWWWSLYQRSAALDAEIARVEAETRQIRSVLEQVRRFETQKATLQQRVTLIEQLRKGQSAPVHLLDQISRSLPDRLWLRELKQAGVEFTMSGMTDSLTAVSDFVANLEETRWFLRPVEIMDSQVQADPKTGDLIRFQIKAQFVDPTAPVEAAPPEPAGGKGSKGGASR